MNYWNIRYSIRDDICSNTTAHLISPTVHHTKVIKVICSTVYTVIGGLYYLIKNIYQKPASQYICSTLAVLVSKSKIVFSVLLQI